MVYHPHHIMYYEIELKDACRRRMKMIEKERNYLGTKYE